MKTANEITKEIKEVLTTSWDNRDGTTIPEPEDVKLGNDAINLDGTVLYADMADSTNLVDSYKDWFAAEVYKSYLIAACHVIRNNEGIITAFDGDRVMAVYIGSTKNSKAAKTALQINWAVRQINTELKRVYPDTSFTLKHSVGIDSSKMLIARTGIRNSNDLVWVGRAANYAAKLSSISDEACSSFITEAVFKQLSDTSKFGGNPRTDMWQKSSKSIGSQEIYKSSWYWEPA